MFEILTLFNKKEICFSKFSLYLLFFGSIGALGALLTGILFTSEMKGTAGEIQETHELLAWITLFLLILTCIIRIYIYRQKKSNNILNRLAFTLYALAAIAVGITGLYGGTLVYNYMMPL